VHRLLDQPDLLGGRPTAAPLDRRDHSNTRRRGILIGVHTRNRRRMPMPYRATLASGTRFPILTGTSFAAFPRSRPLAPPTPQPVAQLCSSASQLLWRSLTSRVRTSPLASRCRPAHLAANSQTWDLSPGSRTTSFRTCHFLRPRRAVQALALTRPSALPSTFATASVLNLYEAQWLAFVLPLPMLRCRPHGPPHIGG
jgi:hypothetical protein